MTTNLEAKSPNFFLCMNAILEVFSLFYKLNRLSEFSNRIGFQELSSLSFIGHILRRNCLLRDAIEGHMAEVKGVGRRTTQLLDDLRNRRKY